MKFFEEPNIEVVKFWAEDIVATSNETLPMPPSGGGLVGESCVS